MEQAAVHAVDGLAATPQLVFVLGVLAIIGVIAIKVVPDWRKFKSRQLEIEAEDRKQRLDIERDRELRKMSEAKMRSERDQEMAAVNARMVDAQDRSTAAMAALTQQMAVMNGQLELSKDRSARMGDQMDCVADRVGDISQKVDEIHATVTSR